MEDSDRRDLYSTAVDESYRSLPSLYLAFLLIWFLAGCSWTFNTYKNRRFQRNNLQWLLASVPTVKVLKLTLTFLFWYSCFYNHICSLWMSFGVYVTGVLFETVTFVSFLLISHGYCITCERLSVSERRAMGYLGCVFYFSLVGYRASVPYFSVLLMISYTAAFYVIFNHVTQNLLYLREQLSYIVDDDVQAMHDAVYTKYVMFKKFQGAMHIVAVAELAILINMDDSLENYWIRLMIRESAQLFIYLYIGWTFRSQDLAPHFYFMPSLKLKGKIMVPPIFSIEMDAASFKDFSSDEWHIGVPTKGSFKDPVVVVIQQPHTYRSVAANLNLVSPSNEPHFIANV